MSKQQQVQTTRKPRPADKSADAPTVNVKITKLWFNGQ
jgi:hypothetical protein